MNDAGRPPDVALGKLLKECRTDAPLPPGFRDAVWRRIENRPRGFSLGETITNWIGAFLPRPALATAYLAVLLALGTTAGWTHGRHENARVMNELGEQYVRSLNPYAMPHP